MKKVYDFVSKLITAEAAPAEVPEESVKKVEAEPEAPKAKPSKAKKAKPEPVAAAAAVSEYGPSKLDLAFLVDNTGSMGSYIAETQKNIKKIANDIVKLNVGTHVRIAVVAYRDHPPQDTSFITRVSEFSADLKVVQNNVNAMSAAGGGDGPEAVTAGLDAVLKLKFRPDALKVCVLIADAPPHGLGEHGDGFPNGSPDGLDPLEICRSMRSRGIILHCVGCEPSLGYYTFARSFFKGISQITGGLFISLGAASVLPTLISSSVTEEFELRALETLADKVRQEVEEEHRGGETEISQIDIDREVQKRLAKTVKIKSASMSEETVPGSDMISMSGTLKSAVAELQYAEKMGTVRKEARVQPLNKPPTLQVLPPTLEQIQRLRLRTRKQVEPLDPSQVRNAAGGFCFMVTPEKRLRRYLCLGSESGSYSAGSNSVDAQNAHVVMDMVRGGKGREVVEAVVDFSVNGRAAKAEPGMMALAIAIRLGDKETKQAAYSAISKVCRIPTHLFMLVRFIEGLQATEGLPKGTGWGRGLRKAVATWYLEKGALDLAMAVTKYQQRDGWSNLDLIRLSHPVAGESAHSAIFKYCIAANPAKRAEAIEKLSTVAAAGGDGDQGAAASKKKKRRVLPCEDVSGTEEGGDMMVDEDMTEEAALPHNRPRRQRAGAAVELLRGFESAKASAATEEEVAELIRRCGLVREHIPTKFLSSREVWLALFERMPMTAMIRNLNKLTMVGILGEGNDDTTRQCCDRLRNAEAIRAARVHPLNALLALRTYSAGKGDKGSLEWAPVPEICEALQHAFYASFANVEPTNQRICIAIDVSGSMTAPVRGSSALNAREASAAMAMVTMRTEPECTVMAFAADFMPLQLTRESTIDEVTRMMEQLPFGPTDCSLPMLWAESNDKRFDAFIIFTDNETYFGDIHPSEAIERYRVNLGMPESKVIVVALSASAFSIAHPEDAGMLDIAGFDASSPQLIRDFLLGAL